MPVYNITGQSTAGAKREYCHTKMKNQAQATNFSVSLPSSGSVSINFHFKPAARAVKTCHSPNTDGYRPR